jgi:hypothetical protein
MRMSILEQIQNWYARNCNGDWEHGYGVKIETIDNPGWSVFINLEGTELEGIEIETIDVENSDSDWIYCKVEKNVFNGAGGLNNLEELLKIFLEWSRKNGRT